MQAKKKKKGSKCFMARSRGGGLFVTKRQADLSLKKRGPRGPDDVKTGAKVFAWNKSGTEQGGNNTKNHSKETE